MQNIKTSTKLRWQINQIERERERERERVPLIVEIKNKNAMEKKNFPSQILSLLVITEIKREHT